MGKLQEDFEKKNRGLDSERQELKVLKDKYKEELSRMQEEGEIVRVQ